MKKLFLGLLHGYQKYVSPMKRPCCRYTPCCSDYAVEAIGKHGALKGSWLAVRRVLRCHPFHEGGYDPVPDIFPTRKICQKKYVQKEFVQEDFVQKNETVYDSKNRGYLIHYKNQQ